MGCHDVDLALGLAEEAMLAAALLRPNCVQEKEFSRPALQPDTGGLCGGALCWDGKTK